MNEPDYQNLQENLARLSREIPPSRDLWPEIQAQLTVPRSKASRLMTNPWLQLGVAATLLIVIGSWFYWPRPETGWDIVTLAGGPQIDRHILEHTGNWRRGEWLETDAASRARLLVGTIGEVELEPNSRLKLLGTSGNNHRVALERGTLHALIWAPPRLFFVETPSATAIDLGCAYSLTVDDSGAGYLEVTAGYVALEHGGRESLIPAGLSCFTRPGFGPGTPFSSRSSLDLQQALERFDFKQGGTPSLNDVLTATAAGDEITLWHLLKRAAKDQRPRVFAKLASLQPPPVGVTQEGVVRGDPAMLQLWAESLGLRNL